jgi:hypothetical protein
MMMKPIRFFKLSLPFAIAFCLLLAWLALAPVTSPISQVLAQEPIPPGEGEFIPAEELPPEPMPTAEPNSAAPALDPELLAAYEAIELARNAGPEAVLALEQSLTGLALELARPEIEQAKKFLALPPAPDSGEAVAVDRKVGTGGDCTYATIAAAVSAAASGDRILIEGGRTFLEDLYINKSLILEGGYGGCASGSTTRTTINGSGTGSVIDIYNPSGLVATLRNLIITGGDDIYGGGIDIYANNQVTLDFTAVTANAGTYGGGMYVDFYSVVTATNDSDIYNNTATNLGGGVRVRGTFIGAETQSDIYNNSAPNGGGISVPGGTLILDGSDVSGNHATGATGQGGGIQIYNGGVVTLTTNVWIYNGNTAYNGAGIYADHATINLQGNVIQDNVAANEGGGLYLTNGSLLNAYNHMLGYPVAGGSNEALRGAGMAVITSTVDYIGGHIINNIAGDRGGGIYARASTIHLTDASVGGTGSYQANQLGPSGHVGAGLALYAGSTAVLDGSTIAGNSFQATSYNYGGGAHLEGGSAITLTNQSSIAYHLAPDTFDGRGAGLYLYDSRVVIDHSQVVSNTAGAVGGGIRLYGTSLLTAANGASISFNEATTSDGGGIAATGTPNIDLTDTTLQYNEAGTDGGAIFTLAGTLDLGGWWDLRWNDAGGNGGAIAVTGTADGDLRVTSEDQKSYLAVNSALGSGGAVYLANTDTLTLHATSGYPLFLNTNSAGGHGGALYADAGGYFDIYGFIQASSNNAGGDGGLAYLAGGSRLWIDDYVTTRPQVLVNWADNGGAIYALNSPRVELDGVDFGFSNNGNKATTGSGGAIYLDNSTLNADNCTFRNSQATLHGGALAAYNSTVSIYARYPSLSAAGLSPENERSPLSPSSITATACDPLAGQCSSLSSNTADSNVDSSGYGGAIYSNGSSLTIDKTYLHHNTAQRGGAIYQEGAGATGVISTALVYSNTSLEALGAGIRVTGGAMTIQDSTLAHNTGGAGYSPGAVLSYLYNTIIWGNSLPAFGALTEAACNIDQGGTAGPALNPLFLDPEAQDFHLSSTSPAIDACASGLAADLDGYPRPALEDWDMGSFEYQPAATATTITGDAPDPSKEGQPFLVSFSVSSAAGIPAGDVIVTVSGDPASCSAALVNGLGSCELTLDAPGDYTLTADYGGAARFLASSDSETHNVKSMLYLPAVMKLP